ncbi:APC family permease [Spirosoma utsteinense]|uniref:Amino acid transporter n=1 Tax=Spirosoma utsteinense TaxID=2585773 RepID=A0ABR6W783_9BACT|nr:amino acid permease [Spirosoma utsteinense]MBC3784882.1 amino acid transporter [Spirosoma utsteinense]MBC3792443.1 amino acid transporter [Spirosoma utsteinense]
MIDSTSPELPDDTVPATSTTAGQDALPRRLNLVQGTALNMIDMVGIGPFVVLPLVIKTLGGPQFMWAWVLGAFISLIDAFVWAELGAAFPQAGGSYNFLKISYGERRWGRLLSFLYVWQTLIQAPLVMASGAIGFAQYASYLMPLDDWQRRAVSGGVVLLIIVLLYRKIDSIGKIGLVMWGAVLLTLGWIIIGGLTNARIPLSETISGMIPAVGSVSGGLLAAGLGQASVKTIYCYLGYYNVCHLGGEIQRPTRNIPASMFISIVGIAALYLLMNLSVVSVVPWQEAQNSEFIVSTFVETLYGPGAGKLATILVLLVAFSSLFAVLLGYSRVPYAAAVDGQFFKIFARLHPTRQFPYVSLLFLGGLGFIFSLLFRLGDVITAILAMRIVIQFVGQAIGLLLLHRRRAVSDFPFRMPLFPLPVLLAICIWLFVFFSTGLTFMLSGLTVIGLGIVAFLVSAGLKKRWPFDPTKGA